MVQQRDAVIGKPRLTSPSCGRNIRLQSKQGVILLDSLDLSTKEINMCKLGLLRLQKHRLS
eukprot:5129220-Amphidinium_carterae.1